jgi:hypothetical protein
MKIRLLLVASFVVVTGVCFAQNVVTQDFVQTTGKNLENAKKPVVPSGKTVLADMKTYHPAMYSQYQSAKKRQRTGIVLTGVGGGVIVMGAILSMIPDTDNGTVTMGSYIFETDGDNSGLRTAGIVFMVGGAACLSVGLPVMIVGGKKKKQTIQEFKNQYYLSQQPLSYFRMNIYPSRVGIAYVF